MNPRFTTPGTRFFVSVLILFALSVSCRREGKQDPDHGLHQRIDSLLLLAGEAMWQSPEKSVKLLSVADSLAEYSGYAHGRARVLMIKGRAHVANSSFDSANICYQKASEIARENGLTLLEAQSLEMMASANLDMGNDAYSLQLDYQALALFEKCNDSLGIAKVYNVLGFYKGQQDEFDSAELYYRKALHINQLIGNTVGLIHNRGNLGYLYESAGRYSEARKMYEESIASLIKEGDTNFLPKIFYNYASLFQKLEKPDSAAYMLRKAIVLSERNRDTSLLSSLYGNLGELELNRGNYREAYRLLGKSAQFSGIIGDMETEAQAQMFLLKLDTLTGNVRQALKRACTIMVLNDSVFRQKSRHDLRRSELKYLNSRQEEQLQLQKSVISEAKRDRSLLILLLIVTIVALILLILFVRSQRRGIRRNRELFESQLTVKNLELEKAARDQQISLMQLEKAEEELTMKERELISVALGVEQKTELLNLVSRKMGEISRDGNGDQIEARMQEIISSIKVQISESANKDLFNRHFNQVHQEFFTRLKEVHPELTRSELRFCAYLKIDLTGNQIAGILNITQEAIRKTRHRLRKKMNLAVDQSLEDYIAGF